MKRLFVLFAVILVTVSALANRSFNGTEVLYLNAGAVSWWQDGGAVQRASFDGGEFVIGVPAADPSKVAFTVPAGSYKTVVFSRASSATATAWNSTGEIPLTGTTENMINTFAENSNSVTWAHYDGRGIEKPACPDELYVIGNIKNVGWTPGSGIKLTKQGQVFTSGDIEFVAEGTNTTCYFCFTSTNSTNWADVNANRYGTSNTITTDGAVDLSYPGEKNATIAPGVYVITVDWETMKVTAEKKEETHEMAGTVLWPSNAVLPTSIPESVRILSLNNSLIHYQTEWQDDIFNQMSIAMGKDAIWTAHTNLGKSLKYHYDEGEGLVAETGLPSARKLIRDNAYTHIILQEQTAKPLTNTKGFHESVAACVKYIREEGANPSAVIILPVNWAYGSSTDFAAENAKLKKIYLDIAQEFGLVLAPVGVAYDIAAATEGTTVLTNGGKWFKDDRHPTQMTTYLGACLEYATIFGVDPTTITWSPTTISSEDAAKMRAYAKQALEATNQPVDVRKKSIRFELRQIDTDGLSVGKAEGTISGNEVSDNVFKATAAGSYTVKAVSGEQNLSSTVAILDMKTAAENLPSIKVNEENKVVVENFNGMAYPAANATAVSNKKGVYGENYDLPEAWRIERNQVGPRTIGAYRDASLQAQYAGGVNLPANASNGTWNLGTNGDNDRALGGMTTGVANGARTINVMVHLENNGKKDFETIKVQYDIEKYREGSNANEFYVKLFTSPNGVTWTEAGEDFTWLNPKGTAQTGFATVPGFSHSVSGEMKHVFEAGTDLYLCWSISTSAGDNCASAPCLAVDNIRLEFIPAPVPEAAHYLYVNDQTGWATLGLYAFGTSELYGGWPGKAMIDTKKVDDITYKVFPFNVTEDAPYTLIFNDWNNGSQAPDFIVTEARDYYLTVTPTSVTERSTTNGISFVKAEPARNRKYVKDGKLYIVHNGIIYNASGVRTEYKR